MLIKADKLPTASGYVKLEPRAQLRAMPARQLRFQSRICCVALQSTSPQLDSELGPNPSLRSALRIDRDRLFMHG